MACYPSLKLELTEGNKTRFAIRPPYFYPNNKNTNKMKTSSIIKNIAASLALLLMAAPNDASARETYKGPVNSGFRIDAVGKNEFVIHPNASNGSFILELPAAAEVADMKGQLVAKGEVANQKVSFRLASEAEGSYHVRIRPGGDAKASTITLQ